MAQLRALTLDEDPKVGGFRIKFDSGLEKEVLWKSTVPAPDSLKAAKEFTAGLLQQLMEEGRTQEIDRTNWVSVTAAVQRLVMEFNERRRDALRALDSSPNLKLH